MFRDRFNKEICPFGFRFRDSIKQIFGYLDICNVSLRKGSFGPNVQNGHVVNRCAFFALE